MSRLCYYRAVKIWFRDMVFMLKGFIYFVSAILLGAATFAAQVNFGPALSIAFHAH